MKKNKIKNKKEISNLVFVIFAFIFNLCIFAPIEIYYTNKQEFWFSIKDVLTMIIPFSLIVFAVLFLIGLILRNKLREIYVKIIFALLTTLYIQGNFLNFGYDTLDGTKVEWNTLIFKGIINSLIWIAIILLPYAFKKLKDKNNFIKLTNYISIFIVLIQIVTISTLVINHINDKNLVLNNKNIINLSKENNIIVIMADTFEGTYMNEILNDHPEYKEKLKDFTYFDNCTGVSFFTFSSMPTLLTGVECKLGNNLSQNVEECFNNTNLYNILKENGYSTEIYVEDALIPDYNQIDNLENKIITADNSTRQEITKNMYKLTLYKYLPHFLKSKFEMDTGVFSELRSDEDVSYEDDTYYLNDVSFNRNLVTNGVKNESANKCFKFYEFTGMHTPYNTTPELEFNNSFEYKRKTDKERRYNEGLASLNLLCNYIEGLKEAGVYENTNIIYLADHGYQNRFYTSLLVKRANDSHDFVINSAPVTTLKDLVPTILNMSNNSKDYGKDFFDYQENEERTRQVLDYSYDTQGFEGNTYKIVSKILFETKGKASEKSSFKIISEEVLKNDDKLKGSYKFGDLINIEEINNLDYVKLDGFTIDTAGGFIPNGANLTKNATLTLKRKKTKNTVTAKIIVDTVYANNQKINFKVNGEDVYSCVLNKEPGSKYLCFEIPKDLWNKEDEVKIDMEFPNARVGIVHSTTMTVVKFTGIMFTNT